MIQQNLLQAMSSIAQLQTAANTSKQVKSLNEQEDFKNKYLKEHENYMNKKNLIFSPLEAKRENESDEDFAKRKAEYNSYDNIRKQGKDSYTWSQYQSELPADMREKINQWEFSTNTVNYSKMADEMQKRANAHLEDSIKQAILGAKRDYIKDRPNIREKRGLNIKEIEGRK